MAKSHKEVSLGSLLLDDPVFPAYWDTGYAGVEVEPIVWQTSETFFHTQPNTYFYAQSSAGRTWTHEGNTSTLPFMSQRVYQYNNPFTAARQYWLSRPEFVYYGKWPNLAPYGRSSDRYPSKWNYYSAFVDQDHVVCAMGTIKNCQLWYYWARYGQYILEVRFFGPNQGMDAALFAQVVAQIDAYIGQQLDE